MQERRKDPKSLMPPYLSNVFTNFTERKEKTWSRLRHIRRAELGGQKARQAIHNNFSGSNSNHHHSKMNTSGNSSGSEDEKRMIDERKENETHIEQVTSSRLAKVPRCSSE